MMLLGRSKFAFALVVALAASMFAPRCSAQAVAVAQIGGIVSDPSGAAISGANIRITQTDEELVRNATTDGQGRYVFPELPVGPYQLEVTASGFKSYVESGIRLEVANNVQINVTMQLGSLTEHVNVTAAATMVETKDNSIAQVISQREIVDLPLNGRDPTQLVLLTGASLVSPAGAGSLVSSKNYFSSTSISIAGGQANGVNYLLDGGDNNDAMTNVNLPLPFPDALQEFSVETSTLPAAYGLRTGGVVNAITKSGTNDFHGDLFEFLRNGALNARNTFAPAPDSLKRNQFGATLGGRIIRDKLFFFGGYQGLRQRTDPPTTISFVPTQAVLNGDFSGITSANCFGGSSLSLIDPMTNQPFPNNKIPVTRFNPQAVTLVSKYIPTSSDPCGQITYGIPRTGDEDQVIGRLDWLQSAKHILFGRYFLAQYQNPAVFDGKDALTTTVPGNWERVQTLTIGDTYTFNPNSINNFHATASRRRDDRGVAPNYISPTDIGLNVYAPAPDFLRVSVGGYWSVGCGTCAPGYFNTNSYHFADDVDIIRGKHQLAFGVDFLKTQFNFVNGYQENGSWSFNGQFTGDQLADYMLGLTSSFTQSNPLQMALRAPILGLYGQDTIRLTPHLTINVGLRWEPTFAAYDKYGRGTSFSLANFEDGAKSKVYPDAPAGLLFYGDPGIPKAYFNSSLALFSPRVGIVWDPTGSGKQTLRVSAGILRDVPELFYTERLTTNAPYGSAISIPSPVGGFTNPYAGYPGGNPFPMASPGLNSATFPAYGAYVNMPLDTKFMYSRVGDV